MALTQTEIEGFVKGFLGLLDEEEPVLEGTPVNVSEMRKIVNEKLKAAVEKNARQERLKVELRESTREVDAANDDAYRTTSGFLDALIGAVGKGSPAAKNFQRLRSRIRQPDLATGPVAVLPVEPVREAVK